MLEVIPNTPPDNLVGVIPGTAGVAGVAERVLTNWHFSAARSLSGSENFPVRWLR